MYKGREITAVIPALNEDTTASVSVAVCSCSGPIERQKVVDKIIVCNNGSTDNTASIAADRGAIVTDEPERGYGAACLAALAVPVSKDIIVFVDADHSVVADELPQLIEPLFDTEKGALSIPQAFGNRLATGLIRLLWNEKTTDLGPFRAVSNKTLEELGMSDRRFGWTVEMQVATIQQSKVTVEVPVSTRQRIGKSKISGTVRGVFAAGHGILGTIFKMYWSGR